LQRKELRQQPEPKWYRMGTEFCTSDPSRTLLIAIFRHQE
jgi:hypothetical protein